VAELITLSLSSPLEECDRERETRSDEKKATPLPLSADASTAMDSAAVVDLFHKAMEQS
jgi:hypothetical protein